MGFSDWYKNFKNNSVQWRAKYFKPLLSLLAKLKIKPDDITVFRLLFVFPLAYCFYLENLWGVLIVYVLFWLLDLLDGALARYLNIQHDKGRFWDSVVDNFMYAFLMLGFIYLQAAWAWLLAYNILIELFTQLLATIHKRINTPSDWLIKVRPDIPYFKSFSHLALLIYLAGYNILNSFYLILNIWLTVTALYYFWQIKNKKD